MRSRRLLRRASWLWAGDPFVAAAMLLLVVYYVATRGVFQGKASGDGYFGFEYLRAIFFDHTLDMQKVMPSYQPFFGLDPVTHHMPNRCPVGPVAVWWPFYLVACGLNWCGRLLHVAGFPLQPDSPFHAWFAGLGGLASVLVGWRYLYVLLLRHGSRAAARLGSTVGVWATPLAWYAVSQPLYQHAPAFLLVAILIERWDATLGESGWRRFALLGFVGGAAMTMRQQEVLYLLLPAGEVAYRFVRGPDRRAWLVGGVTLVAAAVIAFSPQVAVWHYYTGGLHGPQVEPLRLDTPMLVVALFSTRSGLFPWSPIVYASVLGLALGRSARRLWIPLAAVFAVELYVCSAAWVPSGAYSYGARRLSDAAPLFALGVALLYDRLSTAPRRRALVVAYSALCLALCLLTMEMQRQKKTQSSGGYARTGARYLADLGAPSWAQRAVEVVGYPFVQPAGWLFAARHRVSPSAFEGVVGNFMLDREGQWYTVLDKTLPLDWDHRSYVASGLTLPRVDKASAAVTGHVRVLVSMFAAERIGVQAVGVFPPGPIAFAWDKTAAPALRNKDGFWIDLPASAVSVGVNELELDLPAGSTLKQFDFTAYDQWWRKK